MAQIFYRPFSPTEVARKIETVEPKEQQTVVQKAEQAGEMLQTVPRVPVAGVRRRWGNRHTGSLQESSPEVSSSGVLSPPPNFRPSTPESAVVKTEEIHIWDLDLDRGLQTSGDYCATITATTTTTVLPTVNDPASPFTTPLEGSFVNFLLYVSHSRDIHALRKRSVLLQWAPLVRKGPCRENLIHQGPIVKAILLNGRRIGLDTLFYWFVACFYYPTRYQSIRILNTGFIVVHWLSRLSQWKDSQSY